MRGLNHPAEGRSTIAAVTSLTERVDAALSALGVEPDPTAPGRWTVALPSEVRGGIGVAVTAGERTVTLAAFVMRAPDVRHAEVYGRVLRRNLELPVWRFAVDDAGDLFLTAVLDCAGHDADGVAALLDEALGLAVVTVDEMYEPLVRTGFDVPDDVRVAGRPSGAGPAA